VPDQFEVNETGDSYRLRLESTVVYLGSVEHEQFTAVKVMGVVLAGVEETAPLGFLAVLNTEVPFAKFCYYPERHEVTLEYELIGESMDEGEFRNAVSLVADYADHWDDRLQNEFKFGGMRFVDSVETEALR
jgi:hypothetical protein